MRIRIRLPDQRRPFCSCVSARLSSMDALSSSVFFSDNWREHVPLDASAPPGHFRNPYPAPTWANRPSQLAGLARLLPSSLPRTPPPSPTPAPTTLNPTQQGDKATVKSVKVEPSGHPTSSIKSEEPGEGCTPTTYINGGL